jgi:hypothetical protein
VPLKSRVSPSTTLGKPWITSLACTGAGDSRSSAARQPTAAAVGRLGACHHDAAPGGLAACS